MVLEKNEENYQVLKIKVIPNSWKNEILWEWEDGFLKIKVKWVPENWKVNNELIKFLAKNLKIEKSKIKIISGKKERKKLLKVDEKIDFF